MSAIGLTVRNMTNPSVMQQLAQEHERETLAASRMPRRPGFLAPKVRRRLGWSLIGLGVHLALDGGPNRKQALEVVRR